MPRSAPAGRAFGAPVTVILQSTKERKFLVPTASVRKD
jgi:hypothetical protein